MKQDITTLWDLPEKRIRFLLERALELKSLARRAPVLAGRSVGLLFDKASTRTRVSFEAAMIQLGGVPMFINAKDTQISRKEPTQDTARVLSRYLDGLVVRTYSQNFLEELAAQAGIPVVNALTDMYHPCQILSDLMTVLEFRGGLNDVRVAWIGDGNNVAHSWINAAAILGFTLVLACPKTHLPDGDVLSRAREKGKGTISVVHDPAEAARGADVIYTDVWASMGQESEQKIRQKAFAGYTVDQRLVDMASPDVLVMHCLPAHRGEEITEEVLEGERSVVWDQAENKLHMHKAVLEALLLTWS
ncbi:MAG: ornithine carbamoyltransferase [Deltaproteobacteria bacterium]|nr:ornithine carbamoyltransferase [Deltaproteobacteria bacterium]